MYFGIFCNVHDLSFRVAARKISDWILRWEKTFLFFFSLFSLLHTPLPCFLYFSFFPFWLLIMITSHTRLLVNSWFFLFWEQYFLWHFDMFSWFFTQHFIKSLVLIFPLQGWKLRAAFWCAAGVNETRFEFSDRNLPPSNLLLKTY